MNCKNLAGMMFLLAVVLVAAAPYASAAAPATGYYQVGLTENCNAWFFWTQSAPVVGDWQYASGYQDGCAFAGANAGFQVAIKKGQPPNDINGTAGTNRTATDVELSDLYWCLYIGNCSDMFVYVFDIAPDASKKHLNSEVTYYVDGDTFLYEYDEQPVTVTYDGTEAKARQQADSSHANLPPLGSFTPVNSGTKAKDGVRVK